MPNSCNPLTRISPLVSATIKLSLSSTFHKLVKFDLSSFKERPLLKSSSKTILLNSKLELRLVLQVNSSCLLIH